MPSKEAKISYAKGRELVRDGLMTEENFQKAMFEGKIAGMREKESFRLKGVRETITVSFPTPSVRLPKGITLSDLNDEDRSIVDKWKSSLVEEFRPVYDKLREIHTEKVAVKY